MEDAYVIGIRLALDDAVSAGIASIRQDLTALDRAIAGTTAGLQQLTAIAAASTPGAAQPLRMPSPAPATTGSLPPQPPIVNDLRTAQPQAPQPTTDQPTRPVIPIPVPPTAHPPISVQPTQPGRTPPVVSTRPLAPQAEPRPVLPNPPTTVETATRQSANSHTQSTPAAPGATVVVEAGNSKAPRTAPIAPTGPAPTANAPQPARLIQPATTTPTAPSEPTKVYPAAYLRRPDSTPSSPPTGTSAKPATQAAPKQPHPRPLTPSAPPPDAARHSEAPHASQPKGQTAAPPQPPGRTSPTVLPNPFARPQAAPIASGIAATHHAPKPSNAASPALPSAAPLAAQTAAAPTSGDVYLDGARLGQWMAAHLAREAGRPTAGSTGFDPRLGVSWPGTRQGG